MKTLEGVSVLILLAIGLTVAGTLGMQVLQSATAILNHLP